MRHHRLDITERKANMRQSGACEKQPEDVQTICPVCGLASSYYGFGSYICDLGHEYKAAVGIWIHFGDWPQIRQMIVEAQAED